MTRRQRSVLAVGVIATVVIVAAWRLVPTSTDYTADFANASGIKVGDQVRMAGIEVGQVTSIELDRALVHVGFEVDEGSPVGPTSHAAVKMANLLGQHYLEVTPVAGPRLTAGGVIPLRQTESAYTLDKVTVAAKESLQQLDTEQLSRAVDVLAQGLDGDPASTRSALRGMGRLGTLVASRDAQIRRLLHSTRAVTDVVHQQQPTLMRLLGDAEKVATLVYQRRQALATLLRYTRSLVARTTRLLRHNRTELKPALRQLESMLGTLQHNKRTLDRVLRVIGPSARYFANSVGNGPWIDVYAPDFLLSDDVACALSIPGGCT